MHFIFGFAIFFLVAAPSFADMTEVCPAAYVLLRPTPAHASPEELAKIGRDRFEAAAYIKSYGTGVRLPEGGRALAIAPEHMQSLTEAFTTDYTLAAVGGQPEEVPAQSTLNFGAKGNLGHMGDHMNYLAARGNPLAEAAGVNPDALKLAVAAHDIGKGFMDAAIDAWVTEKGANYKPDPSDPAFVPFLHRFVLAHEEHSIARIPQVVEKWAKSLGKLDDDPAKDSAARKKLVTDYSVQIIESIRLHNGVLNAETREQLRKMYPGMSESTLDSVEKAWWAQNYKVYAKAMGLPSTAYTGETNPLSDTLNYIDRVTLTGATAPWKLGNQWAATMGFNLHSMLNATKEASIGNKGLLLAQGGKLAAGTASAAKREKLQSILDGDLERNESLRAFGERIAQMNAPEALKEFNLSAEEMPVDTTMFNARNQQLKVLRESLKARGATAEEVAEAERALARSRPPERLYLRPPGQAPVRVSRFERSSADGKPEQVVTVERWDGSRFVSERTEVSTAARPVSPVDLYMEQAVAAGMWKAP